MHAVSEKIKLEHKEIKKLAITTLLLIVACAIILSIGITLHNRDIYIFFGVVEGLLLGLMSLIGLEEYEVYRMLKNNNIT